MTEGRPNRRAPPKAWADIIKPAIERFEAAVKARDYAAAVEAALGSSVIDGSIDDPMAIEILAGSAPTRTAAARHLRDLVLFGDPVPPALALYVADIVDGKKPAGRPRKSPHQTQRDDAELLVVISALAQAAKDAGASDTAALDGACRQCAELFAGAALRKSKPTEPRPAAVPAEGIESMVERLAMTQLGGADPVSIKRAFYRAAKGRSRAR